MSEGVADRAGDAGRQAHDSDTLDHAVRAGLVVYGLVHLLIGWLALQVALGDSEGSASSAGALHQVAEQPFGAVLIWLVAAGLALLVVWRLLELLHGHEDEDGLRLWGKRGGSVVMAGVYATLAGSAVKVAVGDGSRGGTDSLTRRVMELPGGQLVVGAVGLTIIGVGIGMLARAWTEKFREHIGAGGTLGASGTAYVWFGKVGYAAKGVALGVVGGLFGYAALTHDPRKSGGLDVALQEVRQQPLGPYLLAAIAIGIGCYGLFCFARARHLSR